MALVRIVVPTYNRAALLREALESARGQTFRDFELIIVDDGSTDGTQDVVAEFVAADSRIKGELQANAGVAHARNRGIAAPGEHTYVAFLDSDDVWFPHHLARAIAGLEAAPEAAMAFGKRKAVDGAGILQARGAIDFHERRPDALLRESRALPMADAFLVPAEPCLRALLRSELSPWTSSVVIRRTKVERREWFDTRLEVLEDIDLFLDLAAHPFVFLDDVHGLYRYYGDNLTAGFDLASPTTLRKQRIVLAHQQLKLRRCTYAEDVAHLRKEIAETAWLIGQCCMEQADFAGARSAYLESFRSEPAKRAVYGYINARLPNEMRTFIRNMRARHLSA